MAAKNKSNELKLTRIYDAPVKTVWEAWTDPKQAAQWWGPRGFTLTTHSKDLRPGGTWVYTMHGPDGVDYPNKTVYHEVDKYARLVYDHGSSGDSPPLFRVTVLFSENKGKTKMDLTMTLPTPEAAAETKKFIKKAGGDSTWDRLAEYLEKQATGTESFVINRTFNAPIEKIFELWTDPDQLSRWLPPTGFRMEFIRAEVRPGGETFYFMTNDAGVKMYGKAHYLEIERPYRLIYTQKFVDENENTSRHPLAPTWPETMLTVVTFHEESPDTTRVTVQWGVHGKASAEEMATFVGGRGGMTMGWNGSFDKLDSYIEQLNG